MTKTIVMLDQRIISLFQELPNHPKLYAAMKEAEDQGTKQASTIFTFQKEDEDIPMIRNFEEGIGFIGAWLGIALHGDYSYEDICELCQTMRHQLEERRAVIIPLNN